MGYDVAVRGKLEGANLEAWKKREVHAEGFEDWPRVFSDRPPAESVKAALTHWEAFSRRRRQRPFLAIVAGKRAIEVRGLLDEETFGAEGRRAAALLRSAAEVGARGNVYFAGVGIDLGWVLKLDGHTSRFVREDLESRREVADIVKEANARLPNLASAIRRFTQLDAPSSSAREAALKRLQATEPERLRKAIDEARMQMLVELPSSPEAALALLADPSSKADLLEVSELLGMPVLILSLLDAEAATDLAIEILRSKAPERTRQQAALALAQSTSDRGLDALVGAATNARSADVASAAMRALAQSKHPGVGARLMGMVSARDVKSAGVETPAAQRTLTRIANVMSAIGRLGYRPALPWLAQLFRVKPDVAIAEAIVRIATDAELLQGTGQTRAALFSSKVPLTSRVPVGKIRTWAQDVVRIAGVTAATAKSTAAKPAAGKAAAAKKKPATKPAAGKAPAAGKKKPAARPAKSTQYLGRNGRAGRARSCSTSGRQGEAPASKNVSDASATRVPYAEMGFDVAFWGNVDGADIQACKKGWARASVIKGKWPRRGLGEPPPDETVEEALAYWDAFNRRPDQMEFLSIVLGENTIEVRGWRHEDTFLADGGSVAMLLCSAAEAGARGKFYIGGAGIGLASRKTTSWNSAPRLRRSVERPQHGWRSSRRRRPSDPHDIELAGANTRGREPRIALEGTQPSIMLAASGRATGTADPPWATNHRQS